MIAFRKERLESSINFLCPLSIGGVMRLAVLLRDRCQFKKCNQEC